MEAVDARRAEAEAHRKESTALASTKAELNGFMTQIPGTTAHRQWREAEKLRLARVHDGFEKLKKMQELREHTIEDEMRFKTEALGIETEGSCVSLPVTDLPSDGDF